MLAVAAAAVSCLPPSTHTESGMVVASFEYNINYKEVFGSDSLYFDTEAKIGFFWDILGFNHNVNKETKEFEGGFLMSYLKYPSSIIDVNTMPDNKYRVNAIKTPGRTNTYLVFEQTENMPENHMEFLLNQMQGVTGSCVMNYCCVNNTVAVAKAVEENFVIGDKMLLKARGYLAGKPTGTAEILLAEKSTARDSIMYSWTAFDLSSLGSIDKVNFEIVMPEGKDIPATVCIDEVVTTTTLIYQ